MREPDGRQVAELSDAAGMGAVRFNWPNAITVARIAACPVIFVLALSTGVGTLFAAFVLYVAASLSDLWDGYLARKYGQVTDVGKLLDPLADKLLLVATFVPFYIVSRRTDALGEIPWWGELPLWVVLVVFGREALVTLFRSWAARRGTIISAGPSGKFKTLLQSLFCGGLLLWYPLARMASAQGWDGPVWGAWSAFHGAFVALTLAAAVIVTVYSMLVYFWEYYAQQRTAVGA